MTRDMQMANGTVEYARAGGRATAGGPRGRAVWAAVAVAAVAATGGLYAKAVSFGRWERLHAPPPPEPTVVRTRPGSGERGVLPMAFVAADIYLPNYGQGVDAGTMSTRFVHLFKVGPNGSLTPVDGHVNTSGAGDSIVFQPTDFLDANTTYRFVVDGARDTGHHKFQPYQTEFTTAAATTLSSIPVAFDQVQMPKTYGTIFTSLTVGPDGRLYAGTFDGRILRYDFLPDGTLSDPPFVVGGVLVGNTTPDNPTGSRLVTGICFDPASTAAEPILWVTHGIEGVEHCPDWTCKLSRLTGPDLDRYQDYVVGLPRAWRDHLSFKIAFGPDGGLYFDQGSCSSTGAADNKWGLRDEHLLTAACLRVDTAAVARRVAAGQGPLNVKTEDDGHYDPFAPDAPLTLYATGLRCGFGLLWHSNGHLYSCLNGGAAGGAAPGTPDDMAQVPRRTDQAKAGPYNGGPVDPIPSVGDTQPDIMVDIVKGAYYGHPNVTRGEYVLFGGNPGGPPNGYEVRDYKLGTRPDRNWHPPVWNLGISLSCNGLIEYKGDAFGGALKGKILTTRYSGGKDILVLTPDKDGRIVQAISGLTGFTRFVDPLDLVENPTTGNLYVSEYGGRKITLLRPAVGVVSNRVYREDAH